MAKRLIDGLRGVGERILQPKKAQERRLKQAGWTDKHIIQIARESGVSLNGVTLTADAKAKAAATVERITRKSPVYEPPFFDFDGADAGLNTPGARRARGEE